MPTGGWKIGRIGSVVIRADPSLAIIGLLITLSFWSLFSEQYGSLGDGAALGLAVTTAVLFFLSILVHELAHAGMSRLRDIPVLGITLWMFGGATHAKVEAKGPLDEFLVTVVGPLSTAALGGAFLALEAAGDPGGAVTRMFSELARINVAVALFNLVPGFPLDGGRLLLAGIWRATGDRNRALRLAARAGQGVSLLLIAVAVVYFLQPGRRVWGVWLGIIGWMLFRAAGSVLEEQARRTRLRGIPVRQMMAPPPPSIPSFLPVGSAVDGYLAGHEGEVFPVMEDGRVVGFVSMDRASRYAPDRPVREAMIGTGTTVQAGPDESMDRLLDRMWEKGSAMALVVEDGRLVGVIQPDDLDRSSARRPAPPRPDE